MVASDVTSNFGILTPPALDSPSEVKNSFFPTSGSSMIKGKELSEPSIITAPPSVHDITDGSSEPSTPTSSGPVVQQGSRYYIYDNSILPTLITQIAAARKIGVKESYSYASSSTSTSSVRSSSPGADASVSSGGNDTSPDTDVKASSCVNGSTSFKRKRKGIPFRSPGHEDLERDPGMVFSFPAVFQAPTATSNTVATTTTDGPQSPSQQVPSTIDGDASDNKNAASPMDVNVTANNNNNNSTHNSTHSSTGINSAHQDTLAGPSAIIIHRPVLLPDIVRSITQARRSRMRSRPVTRAKNKRENMEMELLKLSGLEGIIDTDNARNSDDPLIGPSRRIMANTDQRFMSSFSPSQISRSSATGASMSGDKKLARSSAGSNGNNQSYYHASKKRRPSASVSSLSSIPTSELSDYELNSDNFGDDEDDPDFTLHAKKRKAEYVSSKISHSSSVLHASHRRDSNNKTKICASCRTRSTPCWRPGWRNDLFLCNSCGLRYKKTKCVCTNPECRYIPLKSEYNAMFKKPKNGDSPDLKRCCKCQTVL